MNPLDLYTRTQLHSSISQLKSALSPAALASGPSDYLKTLVPVKEELDTLYESTVEDGQALVEIFNKPPQDPHNPVLKITSQLDFLEEKKKEIDEIWEGVWQSMKRNEPIGQEKVVAVPTGHVTAVPGGLAQQSGQEKEVDVVSARRKLSDKYSELEEEAYEVGMVLCGCGHRL